jgi:hypothetical protein
LVWRKVTGQLSEPERVHSGRSDSKEWDRIVSVVFFMNSGMKFHGDGIGLGQQVITEQLRESPDGRGTEDGGNRDLASGGSLDLRDELSGKKRMAPDFEKIVVDRDCRQVEQIPPNADQQLLLDLDRFVWSFGLWRMRG